MKLKKSAIIAIILGVLIVISAVQAFQLSSLKTKVVDGEVTLTPGGSGSKSLPVATSGNRKTAGLPSSISNLPQMVGGC